MNNRTINKYFYFAAAVCLLLLAVGFVYNDYNSRIGQGIIAVGLALSVIMGIFRFMMQWKK